MTPAGAGNPAYVAAVLTLYLDRRKPGLCCCGPDPVSGPARYAVTAQSRGSGARHPTSAAGGALAAGGVRLAARYATTPFQAFGTPPTSEDSFPCLLHAGYCRTTAAVIVRRIPRLPAPQTSEALPSVAAGPMFKKLRFPMIANTDRVSERLHLTS